MKKKKVAPQDLTLLNEFEKNIETVIKVLDNSTSIIDQWIKDLPKFSETGIRFIPQRTSDDVIAILESFYPFADLLPEIKRFLITHVPQFESKVEKRYSDINEKIQEIVHKCGQDPRNPPPNPAIPYAEMCELKRYIELLGEDLRFCVRAAKEEQTKVAGTKGTSGKADLPIEKSTEMQQNINIQNFKGVLGNVQHTENLQIEDKPFIQQSIGTKDKRKGILRRIPYWIYILVLFLAAVFTCLSLLGWLEPIKEFIAKILWPN